MDTIAYRTVLNCTAQWKRAMKGSLGNQNHSSLESLQKHPSFFRYELHLWYCYSVFMLFIKIASYGWNIIKGSKYWQIVLFLGWTKLFFYSWALRTCCCRRLFTHCIDRMPWCKKGLSFWTCCVMLLITASLTAVWISAIRHICN